MGIGWILVILAAVAGAGMLISRKRDNKMSQLADSHFSTDQRDHVRARKTRRRFAGAAYPSSWGYGDGGGGFGGGFDGGGCGGGDGGGGGSC
jgi:uncharacterized membrane protein